MSLKILLLIAGAGTFGTFLRYFITIAFLRRGPWLLPWSTLTVNVLGCFAAGTLYALFTGRLERYSDYAPVVLIGFVGTFTTFSTLALESVMLAQGGELWKALLNLFLQNATGLLAVCGGIYLVKALTAAT